MSPSLQPRGKRGGGETCRPVVITGLAVVVILSFVVTSNTANVAISNPATTESTKPHSPSQVYSPPGLEAKMATPPPNTEAPEPPPRCEISTCEDGDEKWWNFCNPQYDHNARNSADPARPPDDPNLDVDFEAQLRAEFPNSKFQLCFDTFGGRDGGLANQIYSYVYGSVLGILMNASYVAPQRVQTRMFWQDANKARAGAGQLQVEYLTKVYPQSWQEQGAARMMDKFAVADFLNKHGIEWIGNCRDLVGLTRPASDAGQDVYHVPINDDDWQWRTNADPANKVRTRCQQREIPNFETVGADFKRLKSRVWRRAGQYIAEDARRGKLLRQRQRGVFTSSTSSKRKSFTNRSLHQLDAQSPPTAFAIIIKPAPFWAHRNLSMQDWREFANWPNDLFAEAFEAFQPNFPDADRLASRIYNLTDVPITNVNRGPKKEKEENTGLELVGSPQKAQAVHKTGKLYGSEYGVMHWRAESDWMSALYPPTKQLLSWVKRLLKDSVLREQVPRWIVICGIFTNTELISNARKLVSCPWIQDAVDLIAPSPSSASAASPPSNSVIDSRTQAVLKLGKLLLGHNAGDVWQQQCNMSRTIPKYEREVTLSLSWLLIAQEYGFGFLSFSTKPSSEMVLYDKSTLSIEERAVLDFRLLLHAGAIHGISASSFPWLAWNTRHSRCWRRMAQQRGGGRTSTSRGDYSSSSYFYCRDKRGSDPEGTFSTRWNNVLPQNYGHYQEAEWFAQFWLLRESGDSEVFNRIMHGRHVGQARRNEDRTDDRQDHSPS